MPYQLNDPNLFLRLCTERAEFFLRHRICITELDKTKHGTEYSSEIEQYLSIAKEMIRGLTIYLREQPITKENIDEYFSSLVRGSTYTEAEGKVSLRHLRPEDSTPAKVGYFVASNLATNTFMHMQYKEHDAQTIYDNNYFVMSLQHCMYCLTTPNPSFTVYAALCNAGDASLMAPEYGLAIAQGMVSYLHAARTMNIPTLTVNVLNAMKEALSPKMIFSPMQATWIPFQGCGAINARELLRNFETNILPKNVPQPFLEALKGRRGQILRQQSNTNGVDVRVAAQWALG